MNISVILLLLVTGLIAGIFSGSLGVGGAIIVIPMLTFFLGLTQQQAQGTSLIIMSFPVFIISAWNYYKHGYANVKYAIIIVLTFIIGSYIGSVISVYLPEKVMKKIFGLFLVLIGARMLLK